MSGRGLGPAPFLLFRNATVSIPPIIANSEYVIRFEKKKAGPPMGGGGGYEDYD